MVSTQGEDKTGLREEVDEIFANFQKWRTKSFTQKLIDVVLAIVLIAFLLVFGYLMMASSEYGGNG